MSGAEEPARCGFIALIGAPNAGKSTLLNALVGQKVSIVTHKVQTTRTRITGIRIVGDAQLVFLDTPGIFAPKRRLDRAMVAAAWAGAADADIRAVLVDSRKGVDRDVELILEGLADSGLEAVLVLNKIDLVKRESLLELSDRLFATGLFSEAFMVSALNGDGVGDLLEFFAAQMPPGPWMYPEDQISDITERLLAAEITREKIYLRLHQELPYVSTVETEEWEERKDGSVRVGQVIYVTRPGHKGIVLGKKGQTVKEIGQAAREELEHLLGRRVHLNLFVKVRRRWQDDPERFHMMGLDFTD